MKYDSDYIFNKLDKLHNIVNEYEAKELIDEIIGDIDDILFSLKYDIDENEHEIKALREKIFDLERYKF